MTSWLFTFVVHSTLWCGLAWLGLRLFPGTRARIRETIWYMALAASLITPTVHSLTSPDSAVWRIPLPAVVVGGEHDSDGSGHGDGAASVPVPTGQEAPASPTWSASAHVLWLAVAGGLLALYLVGLARLRWRLRDREPVSDPGASLALAAIGDRASLAPPPRLTESHNLASPVALGVGPRREICVPVRALHELDEGEFRALLGHEVAHHLRRDTIRLAVLNVAQAAFFFQPLFRIAVRELRLAAEELCDDWAATQFGDRFAMARCLTEVAGWIVRADRRSPVPSIGRCRSQLERRVRRLMNEHRLLRAPSRIWLRMSAVGLLVLAPLLAPVVTPGRDLSHEERRVRQGAWPREHERLREQHELRERRERHHGSQSQGTPPDSRG